MQRAELDYHLNSILEQKGYYHPIRRAEPNSISYSAIRMKIFSISTFSSFTR